MMHRAGRAVPMPRRDGKKEKGMSYTLEEFCADCHEILKADPTSDGCERIRRKLEELLANPSFVSDTFSEDTPPGRRVLYHDAETDVYVLAHMQEVGKGPGRPHSHGTSWVIYGNARGYTDMTEWRRVNAEDDTHAELEVAAAYRLSSGETKSYEPGTIHSTAHPEGAWVIRVTSTDLDTLPRYRFDPEHDKILADA